MHIFIDGVIGEDTGSGCDTFRAWEHRYSFPAAVRNAKGERVCPEMLLRRLQRIHRYLAGRRPATQAVRKTGNACVHC
jgi:hypothetical protein